ncbi:glycerate kinase [Leifsonia xyli subsp. xyli]|uniref:Glycerate kinase n=2 Tax=Leifsonia xyli subsp. xyli TaxID=59736 RepID=Q6AG88_LEIXX|nr:glycerate kinase [Leifsonia xyli]AAT88607.1 glycerate kinase [Leifsonia xyli subsp. xyli str. CTCB07]ODA90555.1 glycerate kinase [Leifsonia xyli subsp. xyli]
MSRPLRIVVAPDSFKGTADAAAIARALAGGWLSARPQDDLALRPMADGGEGTVAAFAAAVPGARTRTVIVDGPDDRPVKAHWVHLPASAGRPGGTAVIEVAETSGIGLLDPLRPHDAHTRGLGQAIAASLDAGVSQLLIGLGGSASSDGGAGALAALGAQLLTLTGTDIPAGNRGLRELARLDLAELRALPPGGVRLLGDVRSPLLGPDGAAAVFGPQKGATAAEAGQLEANLRRLRDSAARSHPAAVPLSRLPGAGAAGGTGFGLLLWGASLVSGSAEIAERIGLDAALKDADLVITGEGRYDRQTARGKVASHVTALAAAQNTPVALVARLIEAPTTAFAHRIELAGLAGSAQESHTRPLHWCHQAGAILAGQVGRRG